MTELVNVSVSAPGKVILFGEHAVVYGKLAIAASLDLRTYVTFKEQKGNKLQVHFENLNLEKKYHITVLNSILKNNDFKAFKEKYTLQWTDPANLDIKEFTSIITKSVNLNSETLEENHFKSLVSFFCIYFGMFLSTNTTVTPALVSVKTDLNLASGTGSSASFMVSLAAAIFRFISLKNPDLCPIESSDEQKNNVKTTDSFKEAELNIISKWAYFAEKVIHGNPSGIDNTICTYGSFVSFRKTRAPIPIKSRTDMMGLLVDTTVPKDTMSLVQQVSELRNKHERILDHIFAAIDSIADEAIEILVQLSEIPDASTERIQKCYERLEELTALNHSLLRTLNVSHPALENIIQIMKKFNVVGKLTGGGGGGYAIALILPSANSTDLSELRDELDVQGYKAKLVKLGAPGVRIEQ